jgi:formylglycine-generating enzyme required for sulfatase activity
VYVTRVQARTHAAWIGGALPTEAQRLRACQGDDRRTYPWGGQPPDEARANVDSAADRTVPVGSYPAGASPYGALDMAGNVWAWVDDGNAVVRGGAFGNDANYSACPTRYAAAESVAHDNVGFRIVSSTP